MKDAWQHKLSSMSIKKGAKLRILKRLVPDLGNLRCLEIGAETGVLADYLHRIKGGEWHAACLEKRWLGPSRELLGDDVVILEDDFLPWQDASFDFILLSRPEHISDDTAIFRECRRILKPEGGLLVLTPASGHGLPLNILKERLGLTMERYGHYRPGYTLQSLQETMIACGFTPMRRGSYSRFFTEAVELMVNAAYIRIKGSGGYNDYRPSGKDELSGGGGAVRLYKAVLPLLRCIGALDLLLPGTPGYVVYMEGIRE
ncbi:MAG: methyltransferase domain-containing protein [bacterium]|nr:methyltransferase domain-containing protein [bacterium]